MKRETLWRHFILYSLSWHDIQAKTRPFTFCNLLVKKIALFCISSQEEGILKQETSPGYHQSRLRWDLNSDRKEITQGVGSNVCYDYVTNCPGSMYFINCKVSLLTFLIIAISIVEFLERILQSIRTRHYIFFHVVQVCSPILANEY